MKKILLAALLALAAAPAASAQAPVFDVTPGYAVTAEAPAPKAAKAADYHPLWFALMVTADEGVGSGTPVLSGGGKTLVLTNAHVARQDRRAFAVTVPGGRTYPARRVDGSTVRSYVAPTGQQSISIDGADLAVVEVDAELGAVPIAKEAPAPGEVVQYWGYSRVTNGEPVYRTGVVIRNAVAEPTLTSTIPCASGDSGSGVFNVKGELVAVTHGSAAAYGGEPHHAVALTEVRKFLGRPLLSRLFPQLSDRLAARRAAADDDYPTPAAPKAATPAPKADPAPKAAAPAPKAPAAGRMYHVGNGPWMSEAEFRERYPLAGRDDCPNGRCPLQQPANRR